MRLTLFNSCYWHFLQLLFKCRCNGYFSYTIDNPALHWSCMQFLLCIFSFCCCSFSVSFKHCSKCNQVFIMLFSLYVHDIKVLNCGINWSNDHGCMQQLSRVLANVFETEFVKFLSSTSNYQKLRSMLRPYL